MRPRTVGLALAGVAVIALAGFAGWTLTLPPAPAAAAMPPIAAEEAAATIAALKPPKRERPVIAILGVNEGTEITDYMMPYGILKRADVADVVALGTQEGPVTLFPGAIKVEPQATTAAFDQKYPDGADYVIVPQMHRHDDPAALAFIKQQADKGATVVGVCAGARIVAVAGLLEGKRGTTHWYYLPELRERSPSMEYVADRRIVVDGRVATTTGVSASMPMSLTLIEAIAGRAKAEAVAESVGLPDWDARHSSASFVFNRPFATTALVNTLAFWNREDLGLKLTPGIDEVTLALTTDAWSRTFRSQAVAFAADGKAVVSANGLRILPDSDAADWPEARRAPVSKAPPAEAFDETLGQIETRYGKRTADMVAMQLEYRRR